jgi:hypothetical protein
MLLSVWAFPHLPPRRFVTTSIVAMIVNFQKLWWNRSFVYLRRRNESGKKKVKLLTAKNLKGFT